MDKLKINIRAVLQSAKNGVEASNFEDHYRSLTKENIQYAQYGYKSLDELMANIPDTVYLANYRGTKIYRAVCTDSTYHLQKLIDRQKSVSARKSKPVPNRRRPLFANENLQNSTCRYNRYEDNRKRYPNVRVTVDSSGRGQQVNCRGDVKRSVEMGDINANCNKHEIKSVMMSVSKSNRVFEKAVKDISSNEQVPYGSMNTFPLAPRFQKQKNNTPAPDFVKGRHEHIPRSNKVSSSVLDGKQYTECLVEFVSKNSLSFAIQALPVENGFTASIQIKNEVYESSARFPSEQEAQYSAAKNACISLGLDPYKMDDPVGIDEHELKKRVQQIVVQNGLWLKNMGETYEKQFGEKAPDNLQDLVRSWVDVFKIEQACATQMEIVYPVKQSLVSFTGKEVEIKHADLLPVGSVLNVYVSFIYSAAQFYVHYETSCIQEIDAELNLHCQKRHVDIKALQIGGFCVAQYSDNDAWYRASILDIDDEKGEVEVYYVDYGNTERVSIDRITKLPTSVAHYPAQAILCALFQLIPPQEETDFEASKQEFGALAQDQLQAKTVLIDNKVCHVILINPESPSKLSINDILVNSKLAYLCQTPEADPEENEPAPLMLPADRFWDVYVCFLSSTTDVIIRIVGENYSDKLEKLEKEIEKWFPELPNGQIQEGDICAAEVEGFYHRVKVLQMKESRRTVECLFLDHGDSDRLVLNQLRVLDSTLNYLPYQAIPCVLAGLEQYSCNIGAIDKLMEMALGKTCVAEAVTKDNKIFAVLYDTMGEDDININKAVAEFAESEGTDLLSSLVHDGTESVSSSTLSELSMKSTTTLENVMKQSGLKDSATSPTASSSSHTSPVSGHPPDSPASFSLHHPNPNSPDSSSSSSVCSGIVTGLPGSSTPLSRSSDRISAKTPETPAMSTTSAVVTPNSSDFPSSTSSVISSCSDSSNTDAVWSKADYIKLKPPGPFKMAPIPDVTFVYIDYIADPSNFHIIPFDFLAERDNFTARLTDKMKATSPLVTLTDNDVLLSHPYVSNVDDAWYRVIPSSVCEDGGYFVWYADYGGYDFECTENLKPLPEEFWDLPYQSVTCKLNNFIPKRGDTWSEAAKYKFLELANNKCFACIVKDTSTATDSGSASVPGTESAIPVVLIDTCGEEDVCIDEVLLAFGYGQYKS
ncbi:Hypothetical predicted protein [Octopus vulgaris]|nr:Hypothetical predicted protein [Octopus vulgaris]